MMDDTTGIVEEPAVEETPTAETTPSEEMLPPPEEVVSAEAVPEALTEPDQEKVAALEAVLFMAAEPIAPSELAEILDATPAEVTRIATALSDLYLGRGLQVTMVAGGYQVATRSEYGKFVAKLHKPERFRLSKASLETLAIVAYKQPVTRPEVDAIRGVNSDSAVETLMQYQLICEAGRKETPGRPMLYQTTESFLGHFGLNSVEDLPNIDSIPADEEEVRAEVEAALGTDGPCEVPAGEEAGAQEPPLEVEGETTEEPTA
jgi:segregation and condensation protein B